MLINVKKAREDIVMKLGMTPRIKPGTFLRPVEQLLRRQMSNTTRHSSTIGNKNINKDMDDHTYKFLEKQNDINNEV